MIVIVDATDMPDKEYRQKLKKLWRIAPKFGFEPHGYTSVFVGEDEVGLELFLETIKNMGLEYHVEKVDGK